MRRVIRNLLLQPFLKWAGWKRQLLPEIRKYLPKKFKNYHEPFIGAGAVLFDCAPKNAFVNDLNADLINCYEVIKGNVEGLVAELKKYKNDRNFFYKLRELDRNPNYMSMSAIKRAARIIYLNKTCYNGLFRVNSQGFFNTPFWNYRNPNIVNEWVLRAVSHYLNTNNVQLYCWSYEIVLEQAKKGDFVYLDPPYDPISDTASFTGYNLNQFNKDDQIKLREVFGELDKKGCYVLLSNSSTDFIHKLYQDYTIRIVGATRNINSMASKRGKVDEVLIFNYKRND